MAASVVIGVLMLFGKWAAFLLTGSHAIGSDAIESVVHVAATCFALFSLTLASRPPDPNYPYGYGKIEYFSAGFEGGLIALAGLAIVYGAIQGLVDREPLRSLDLGLALITIACVVNLALGTVLIRQGRATRSLILEADGQHVLTDAYTSVGVLLGIAIVRFVPRLWWLDPVVALVIGLNILRTAYDLVQKAFTGLMGRADRGKLAAVVGALQAGRQSGWLDMHQLRAWQAGDQTFVDFHLVVPADWTVAQIHDAHIEARELIRAALDGAVESIVHFDPDRADRPVDPRRPWTVDWATRPSQAHPGNDALAP
jgi:cation diffusion facilitator family transporter